MKIKHLEDDNIIIIWLYCDLKTQIQTIVSPIHARNKLLVSRVKNNLKTLFQTEQKQEAPKQYSISTFSQNDVKWH